MNLVGDPILADEAFELGLVNRLVEDHELLDTALQWARKLAAQAPLAVAQIKSVATANRTAQEMYGQMTPRAAELRVDMEFSLPSWNQIQKYPGGESRVTCSRHEKARPMPEFL